MKIEITKKPRKEFYDEFLFVAGNYKKIKKKQRNLVGAFRCFFSLWIGVESFSLCLSYDMTIIHEPSQ